MTSSAQSPHVHGGGQYGEYRNIALVEVAEGPFTNGWLPSRIDKRLTGVRRVEHWGRFYVGKSDKCAYQRTLKRAEMKVRERNSVALLGSAPGA